MRSADSLSSDAREQLARLRDQVDSLMRDRVGVGIDEAAGRAEKVARRAAAGAREQADALSGRVRDQPLIAVVAALGIGYLLGRFIR
ncbi:hypothetical protein [Acidisphaera rubrifaciens]|uniref:DUF883 domain-containing protein n=1 Tax=Acidisphaera rubrifaciens HS-AP3 TaxID=1231350 RepID=A0A0D6P866_9PROT|nr:hypothetical protein [Acidisphaera rubrifaciens]GAN77965.1 hypothetical protein Asru_0547_02 [Acidisphaera rubrifaciens HS-AP3]